jgi:hypothetical protein
MLEGIPRCSSDKCNGSYSSKSTSLQERRTRANCCNFTWDGTIPFDLGGFLLTALITLISSLLQVGPDETATVAATALDQTQSSFSVR